MDRFIRRDEVVFCISSPHICPVPLGSGSARFCWDTDMQVFFFFSLHKQTCGAKPSQAADRRQCQMHKKRENVLYRPELCNWEGCVFSIAFKQNAPLPRPPFLAKQSVVCVWCLEMDFLKLSIPEGMEEKVFQIYDAVDNGNRNILAENRSGFFL